MTTRRPSLFLDSSGQWCGRTLRRRPSFLSFLVVTHIRGHITGSFPPSPLRFLRYIMSREDFSYFFPRRLASNCALPTPHALNSWSSLCCFWNLTQNLTTAGFELQDQHDSKVIITRPPGRYNTHRGNRPYSMVDTCEHPYPCRSVGKYDMSWIRTDGCAMCENCEVSTCLTSYV